MITIILFLAVLFCMPDTLNEHGAKRQKKMQEEIYHLKVRDDIKRSVRRY